MKDPLSALLKEKGNRLCTVLPSITVEACIQKMNTEKIGAILVVESNGQLVGMFTERDVLNKIFPQQIDIKKTTVDKVMTTKLVYAKPTSTVDEAMATFTERRFRHLPVMENDKLIGLVSIGDVTKWVLRKQQDEINYLSDYISGAYK
jgi:CBS domain-containing protein